MWKKIVVLSCIFGQVIGHAQNLTFTNNSPFTLALNQARPDQGNTCLDSKDMPGPCASLLPPGKSQNLRIDKRSGFNLNYTINALTANNYNLNIQNQDAGITISFTHIADTTTTRTINNAIVFKSNTLAPNPVFNPARYSQIPFVGVNLSGAEAAGDYMPAWLPSAADTQYFVNAGMNTVRMPVNWNFLTPTADVANVDMLTPANMVYLNSVYTSVEQLLHSGVNVVLDLHDYMRYQANSAAGAGNVVSPTQINAIWTLLAVKFSVLANTYNGGNKPNQLVFEIMNEPDQMSTSENPDGVQQTLARDNAGIAAVRGAGLKNLILIEGDFWSDMHSWLTKRDSVGETNAQVFVPANIQDPADNYAIAVHEYFDRSGSGTSPYCQGLNSFVNYVNFQGFMNWARQYHVRVFLSEFGSGLTNIQNPDQDRCTQDINYFLDQIRANADTGQGGFIGWAAWTGGHGWNLNNINNLSPDPRSGKETLQMQYIYKPQITKLR